MMTTKRRTPDQPTREATIETAPAATPTPDQVPLLGGEAATQDLAVLDPTFTADLERQLQQHEAQRAERYLQLRKDARASYRAMEGWWRVRSADAWEQTCQEAADAYESGRFLIERLGGERHLDPELMATLLALRRQLIDDMGAHQAHERMLVDMAVVSYYHTLRIHGWIGDLAILTEHDFFGETPLTATMEARHGRWGAKALKVEERVERLSERLLPLLDRANRMMIRNLKAIEAMRPPPAPAVAIGSAGQVNVGALQNNTATSPIHRPEARGTPRRLQRSD
jgi:hypothetical protein